MEREINTTVLTAASAVIVAIISAIVAVISARRSSQARLELEAFRANLELDREKELQRRAEAQKRADVLGRACSCIQKVKDHLQDLRIETEQPSYIVNMVRQDCDEIVALYADRYFMLPNQDRRTFHDIKNTAKEAVKICNRSCDEQVINKLLGYLPTFEYAQQLLTREYEKWQELGVYGDDEVQRA